MREWLWSLLPEFWRIVFEYLGKGIRGLVAFADYFFPIVGATGVVVYLLRELFSWTFPS